MAYEGAQPPQPPTAPAPEQAHLQDDPAALRLHRSRRLSSVHTNRLREKPLQPSNAPLAATVAPQSQGEKLSTNGLPRGFAPHPPETGVQLKDASVPQVNATAVEDRHFPLPIETQETR